MFEPRITFGDWLTGIVARTIEAPAATQKSVHLSWRTADVQGQPARYAVAGSGSPVVLVHGLSGSTRWWQRNLPALADHHRVYLVDLPGFGGMTGWQGGFALAEAADWVHAWMDAVSLSRANLVGHSMGGYISLELAARHPEAVSRLTLVNPAGIPTGHDVVSATIPLATAVFHTSPAFYPTLLVDGLRAGPATVLRAASEILAGDVRELLAEVSAPTLLIWGKNDTLVPVSAGAVMREALPNARLLVLEGAGHVSMFDRPHAFNRAVLRFLAEDDADDADTE